MEEKQQWIKAIMPIIKANVHQELNAHSLEIIKICLRTAYDCGAADARFETATATCNNGLINKE